MVSTPITAFYAGLLAIVFLYLSGLVSYQRRIEKISLGDGGSRHMRQAIRVHGNFAEYVPLMLVLMLVAELNHIEPLLIHFGGVAILLGRVLHAYGLRHHYGASWQRIWGSGLTYLAIAVLAALNVAVLYDWRL